jgi:hypothetical protein
VAINFYHIRAAGRRVGIRYKKARHANTHERQDGSNPPAPLNHMEHATHRVWQKLAP